MMNARYHMKLHHITYIIIFCIQSKSSWNDLMPPAQKKETMASRWLLFFHAQSDSNLLLWLLQMNLDDLDAFRFGFCF